MDHVTLKGYKQGNEIFLTYEYQTRAFELRMECDLMGDWTVTRYYGDVEHPASHHQTEAFKTWNEAYQRLQTLHHYRVHNRHYTLTSISST